MRHFYTTMLAAMVATTSFAQSTVKTQSLLEANTVGTLTTCPIKQQAKVLPFGAKKTNFRLPNFAKKTTKSLAKRVKNNAVDTPMVKKLVMRFSGIRCSLPRLMVLPRTS